MVIAPEIPARDHPVSADIGSRYTASENIAPTPTHVISAPAPTITQRYDGPMRKMLHVRSAPRDADAVFSNRTNGNRRRIQVRQIYF